MPKKVMVSGCYDLLHSGHIAFFESAAAYGDLYVALGSDQTIYNLKGRVPINSEEERLYMVKSVAFVKDAFISRGSGFLDFIPELKSLEPDIFVVNEDGNTPDKQKLCEEHGIEYVVLKREPSAGLDPRSTTALRTTVTFPFRIDLAGGWLDQPFVSQLYPGPVLTVSIEPTVVFNERSGMATSTRRKGLEMWGPRLPAGDPEKLAKILFCYDNPPGTREVSGSQDSIGLVIPGLNKSWYDGKYWPEQIESVRDEMLYRFVEDSLYLIPLGPRVPTYSVLAETNITRAGAEALSDAAQNCWEAILHKDVREFGRYFRASFEAQIAMFPSMVNEAIMEQIQAHQDQAYGWKLSGAGGGGYIIFVSDRPVANGFKIIVRREVD